MQPLPHGALTILYTLPLLGLGVLAVVLLALVANRDRWIVPGTLAVIFAASGWAATVEYGGQMKNLLARPEPNTEIASAETVPPEPTGEDTAPTETPENVTSPARPAAPPARDRKPPRIVTEGPTPTLLPVTGDRRAGADDRDSRADGRRTMVVNPTQPEPRPVETARPVPAPVPAPVTPRPAPVVETPPPRVVTPQPAPVTPPPQPVTTIARTELPEPIRTQPPTPTPAPSGGNGTLVITISGPLVETSQTPVSSPNILVILDGKKVNVASPSRVTEKHQQDDPGLPLLAVTYFWENITFTFPNIEAGWHVIMLDTSLEDPRSHQARMIGSQDQNDYNGAVEIKAGKTTTMTFGAKNFMTGRFPPPQIR